MSVSQESFKKKLKEKGLKVTNQRLLVLQVLAENKDRHLTAEDIYELVKKITRRSGWQPFTEQCSCYWKCNWWIVLIWMMDVCVMRSGRRWMAQESTIITI